MSDEQPPRNNFSIQKIYVKDISFESPEASQVFGFQKWEPKIELNLKNEHSHQGDDRYEVVLQLTATATQEDKTAFLIEVQQAGIFIIQGFKDDDKNYLLGSQCLNILMPYAREVISDMTTRGGFPPLVVSPLNFDMLYRQQQEKKAAQAAGEQTKGSEEEIKH
ncbi:MAG: protein-export chaperone SecB [Gammaproteobacteria bacterium]|nr:protein-export chaperone SecB [Gammaproteobacteria bacterium]